MSIPSRAGAGRELVRFWFNNKAYQGYRDDTLAAALLANGVSLVARSFKYHRPRGIFSAGCEEPNALVQLERGAYTEPNRRATEIELYDGLIASSQNCWPSVNFDLGALSARFARLLPAGFYYKTFMWPASRWLWYEKWIRRAAGLGRAPTAPDPDYYDKTYVHCDVLIIGGGPAGLQAAQAAGVSGARVMVMDEKSTFGGSLLGDNATIDEQPAHRWVARQVAALQAMPEVVLLPRTTVTGYYNYNFLVANERVGERFGPNHSGPAAKERLWKIRAKQVVLATGAIERPLVFADNDRPGVMLASAIRHYLHRFSVLAGRELVFFTNNDSAYYAALDCHAAGGRVQIVDLRDTVYSTLPNQARANNIPIHCDSAIVDVIYRRGRLRGVNIMRLTPAGDGVVGKKTRLRCEVVGVSGGWTPTVHLYSQAQGKLRYAPKLHSFIPDQPAPNNPIHTAGACTGEYTLAGCLRQGYTAGARAASAAGFTTTAQPTPAVNERREETMRPLWLVPCEQPMGRGKKKHFHELQNDATVADLHLAVREGFAAVEHLKRYTTTGMGTDQGKTSNLNALCALAQVRNVPLTKLGLTTYRPPYTPLTLGAIVGHDRHHLYAPVRKTAVHPWHDRHGAVYEDVGDWKRPHYYPRAEESMAAAVARECLAVRQRCGVLDASTLGKIDLQGKDATKLLNMLYTNAWDGLAVGRGRYGVMLNEHGMVIDDGVTTCLAPNHYHMTTTTGGAARVLTWIEEWLQTEWRDWEVHATSVTEQWAVAALSGPNAVKVLGQLTELPLDEANFPFMSMQAARVANIPARIFTVSFTGERGFEINVPARYGVALWEALATAGQELGLCPYGTEAMHVLRAEKGFIIVGQDTDGSVTPLDLGLARLVSKRKPDFLGKRSLTRTDTARTDRKQLVGLLTEQPELVLPEGTHIVAPNKPGEAIQPPPTPMLGHISSSYFSANLNRSIALAMIKDGFARTGQTLQAATMGGSRHNVSVTEPVFVR